MESSNLAGLTEVVVITEKFKLVGHWTIFLHMVAFFFFSFPIQAWLVESLSISVWFRDEYRQAELIRFDQINQSNNCFRFSLPLGIAKVKKHILYLWYLTKASTTIHTVQSLWLPDL